MIKPRTAAQSRPKSAPSPDNSAPSSPLIRPAWPIQFRVSPAASPVQQHGQHSNASAPAHEDSSPDFAPAHRAIAALNREEISAVQVDMVTLRHGVYDRAAPHAELHTSASRTASASASPQSQAHARLPQAWGSMAMQHSLGTNAGMHALLCELLGRQDQLARAVRILQVRAALLNSVNECKRHALKCMCCRARVMDASIVAGIARYACRARKQQCGSACPCLCTGAHQREQRCASACIRSASTNSEPRAFKTAVRKACPA